MIEVGDIVANPYGHVMAVGSIVEDPERGYTIYVCFYECNPTAAHRYKSHELTPLSKTKGVDMKSHNASQFQERIQHQLEWAKGVHGLPRKYRERDPKPAKAAQKDFDLNSLSTEQLLDLVKKLGGKK